MPASFKKTFAIAMIQSPWPIFLYSMPIALPAMVMGSIQAITCVLAYSEKSWTLYDVIVSGITRTGVIERRECARDVGRFGAMCGNVDCLVTANILLHSLLFHFLNSNIFKHYHGWCNTRNNVCRILYNTQMCIRRSIPMFDLSHVEGYIFSSILHFSAATRAIPVFLRSRHLTDWQIFSNKKFVL